MSNLTQDAQFAYYKGMIYANNGLSIHDKINNKATINALPVAQETFSRNLQSGLHKRHFVRDGQNAYYVWSVNGEMMAIRHRKYHGENVVFEKSVTEIPLDVMRSLAKVQISAGEVFTASNT